MYNNNQHNKAEFSQQLPPLSQKQEYDFQTQNKVGKTGEAIVDQWLQIHGYRIEDVSDLPQYQKAGIDRVLIRPNGSTATAEYKTDIKAKQTGNLFFEACDDRNRPCWGWTSQADLWIFFIPQQEILVVEPGKFRLLVSQQQPELSQKVVPNRGYSVTGLPVPLVKVRNIASHVFKFPDVLF